MMDRLRDAPPSEAQRLVSAMEPIDVTPALAAGIRRRLDAPSRRRTNLRVLRLAIVVAVLLASAFAAAAAAHHVLHRAQPEPQTEPRKVEVAAVEQVVAQPVIVATTITTVEPVAATDTLSAPVATAKHVAPPKPAKASDEIDPEAPDAFLVIAAIQTLRHDGNATKADSLLVRYLQLHPNGALAEEALALRIEALAHDDDARAATIASRYLEQFPRGRYAEAARRARVRFAAP
jgi:hypothetical protein